MIILLHSSKTMHKAAMTSETTKPALQKQANELHNYLKSLTTEQISRCMQVSATVAEQVQAQLKNWRPTSEAAAIDTFLGDIYSGLQVGTWTNSDRTYAQAHLRILSGLYGILRPLDGIQPYRLEMGYKLPDEPYRNLYSFWGDKIASQVQDENIFLNLSAVEYGKTITKFKPDATFIAPKFLTVNPKTHQPTFVVVHAKIARGAFARWVVQGKIENVKDLIKFNQLGYVYDKSLSSAEEPVFVCQKFGGLGLSVRIKKQQK